MLVLSNGDFENSSDIYWSTAFGHDIIVDKDRYRYRYRYRSQWLECNLSILAHFAQLTIRLGGDVFWQGVWTSLMF